MSQTDQLTSALKKALRANGMTYLDVAKGLGISHASVKRVFSQGNFTLKRLEQICALLDTNFFELAKLAREGFDDKPAELTLEQERILAANPKGLTVFNQLLEGWDLERVTKGLPSEWKHDVLTSLMELEKAKLIEVMPNNKVRLLTARKIRWRMGGPVRRYFEERVMAEFVETDFSEPRCRWTFAANEVSDSSLAILERKIDNLLQEFKDLAENDTSLPDNKRHGTALLVAFRPVDYRSVPASLFEQPSPKT